MVVRIPAIAVLFNAISIAQNQDGERLFEKHCAVCHRAGNENRAPLREALARMAPKAILASLESGSMKEQSAALSHAERELLANHLGSRDVAATTGSGGMCPEGSAPRADASQWNGWGVDLPNTRFQPAALARMTPEQVQRLRLRWAFGFPGAVAAIAQPALVAGRLYFGSQDGTVYSTDARSGCIYWTYKAGPTTRTAITISTGQQDRFLAYFGDAAANVHAVDANSGKPVWKLKVDDHPVARITGAPKIHNGRLYVPVSSIEEVSSGNAKYGCCTFRGSLVAVDTETGKQLWKSYTIPDPPKPTRINSAGVQLQGPSGAAVWTSPTIDTERNLVYIGTGNGYSDPANAYTDAVIAFDLETGSMKWVRQLASGDGWNFSCINPNKANCPEQVGPDVDIGASPILKKLPDGRTVLVVGQKSGIVHALDPDAQGKILWQTRVGRGGALGGVQWGMAADEQNVYVALSDFTRGKPEMEGGMFALRLANGEKVWHTAAPKPACIDQRGCSAAQMAPVSLIPGVVFSGSMDGHLRAYSTSDGKILWDFDTLRDFDTVNGVKARGGSLSATGPVIAGGWLYVNSGYGILGGMPGNVLLAFSVD